MLVYYNRCEYMIFFKLFIMTIWSGGGNLLDTGVHDPLYSASRMFQIIPKKENSKNTNYHINYPLFITLISHYIIKILLTYYHNFHEK